MTLVQDFYGILKYVNECVSVSISVSFSFSWIFSSVCFYCLTLICFLFLFYLIIFHFIIIPSEICLFINWRQKGGGPRWEGG